MSDKQPEALRLADLLEFAPRLLGGTTSAAAACLRSQHAEIQRLASEVANRNRRAIKGDKAVAALSNVHTHYEGLEAERDALLEALKAMVEVHDKACWFDHNGYCQEHCMDHVMDGCRVANARAAIAKAGGNDE